ncbi:SDR family NAD(P)-dependent oxidoreductase [Rhizobium sp. BK602]|uniref:SDR family NAD(P)-dependent oxidoreductase n=1 Tax=Rhizobium sp. BK602 TaxID=2586986 RepID=UPI00161F7274|nr:SDR family NAD(P)-dependent oxidoreductase [Rhizobium sp. BK602]MBB3610810.1 NAD(P)-dependent dehydrogenase (short-subunit alcohol dehydrogenase family) [Rhizobium sp. BK602]
MKRDRSWTWQPIAATRLDFTGLKIAVIGGTGGIGRALSRHLAAHGANVVVVGQTFRDSDLSGISFIKADLSLMQEARRVGASLPAETLDLVIFTTGIMAGPTREQTLDGIERDVAISYLSRFVMLNEIGPRLGKGRTEASTKPRVFVMGFPGSNQLGKPDDLNSETSYSRWTAHMNTVAGNEALVLDAAARYPQAAFFGLNPGFVKTGIRSNLFGPKMVLRIVEWMTGFMTSSPESYAERIAPLLISPDIEGHSGAMFNNKGEPILPSSKLTNRIVSKIMAASETLAARAKVQVAPFRLP